MNQSAGSIGGSRAIIQPTQNDKDALGVLPQNLKDVKINQLTQNNEMLGQYMAEGAKIIASLKGEVADLRGQLAALQNKSTAAISSDKSATNVHSEVLFQCHMNYGKLLREKATALAEKHNVKNPLYDEYKRSGDFANERTFEIKTSGNKEDINAFLKELRSVLEAKRGRVNNNQIFKLVQPPTILE